MHYAWALLGKYCPNLAIISHYIPKACNLTLESNPRWGFHRPNQSFPLICMIITACLVDLEITVWVNFARKWADISRSSIINFLKVFNVLFQGDVDDVVLLCRAACQISCTRLSLHVRLFLMAIFFSMFRKLIVDAWEDKIRCWRLGGLQQVFVTMETIEHLIYPFCDSRRFCKDLILMI